MILLVRDHKMVFSSLCRPCALRMSFKMESKWHWNPALPLSPSGSLRSKGIGQADGVGKRMYSCDRELKYLLKKKYSLL